MYSAFENLCRTCMLNNRKHQDMVNKNKVKIKMTQMVSIFSDQDEAKEKLNMIELIKATIPQLKIKKNDQLPKSVCLECSEKIKEIYKFQQNCLNNEMKYFKMLEEHDAINLFNDSDDREDVFKTKFKDSFIEETSMQYDELIMEAEVHRAAEATKKFTESCSDLSIDLVCDDDSSDAEWEQKKSQSSNEKEESITEKRNLDRKVNGVSMGSTPTKISRKKFTKKRKEDKEGENTVSAEEVSDCSVSCQQCKLVFDSIILWKEHMGQHRLEKLQKRKNTKKTDSQRENHCNQRNYKCEQCGKVFAYKSKYRYHKRTHKDEEPSLCIECGKTFRKVSSLNTHMLRHKGEKTYQCQHCPKNFVCSSGLYGHMMVHSKEKPYVCKICGSAFHMAYQLRKHNLYHDGIKNYQCEYCDMRFVTREKQRRHMRTHTGEKPYRCKYCERAFAQSNDCVKHLRQHLGDNVYQCELCPLRYPLARDLRAHFATHKDDDEETRARNLEARMEEERNLQDKFSSKET